MSLSDPIADMLTRIRNASSAGREMLELPYSNVKNEIARILKREGYIIDYTDEGEKTERKLRLFLKYAPDGTPLLRGLRRISRPGRRRYAAVGEMPKVLNGLGIAIVSTSAGIVTDHEARRNKTGGEIFCYVW